MLTLVALSCAERIRQDAVPKMITCEKSTAQWTIAAWKLMFKVLLKIRGPRSMSKTTGT